MLVVMECIYMYFEFFKEKRITLLLCSCDSVAMVIIMMVSNRWPRNSCNHTYAYLLKLGK